MPETVEFELADRAGQPHSYLLTLHPATEGRLVAVRLLALGAEPLGRLVAGAAEIPEIFALLKGAASGPDTDAPISQLTDLLRRLDLAKLGADIRSALLHPDADALLASLFRHLLRDGKQLRDSHAFDVAYRGNYGEMLQAAWRVASENGFFPGLDTFSS